MLPATLVLRIFGYCPRAGLFAAATLSRFWNSVATNAWLGFALAAFCAFYAVFASPSQDKLSGLWGGCSFTFHTFCFRDVIAWGFTSQTISLKHGLSQEIPNSRPNPFVQCDNNYILPFSASLHSGSGVGASYWVSPKPSFTLRRFICCSGVGAVCVTSLEPSSALLTEFVDGFLTTLCL